MPWKWGLDFALLCCSGPHTWLAHGAKAVLVLLGRHSSFWHGADAVLACRSSPDLSLCRPFSGAAVLAYLVLHGHSARVHLRIVLWVSLPYMRNMITPALAAEGWKPAISAGKVEAEVDQHRAGARWGAEASVNNICQIWNPCSTLWRSRSRSAK